MIKGGTRGKQCEGGAGKSCSSCAEGCLEEQPPKGVVVWWVEKLKISILETTVEIFGLNWQLIELAS
jgi:hypothetical protein